MFVVRRPLTLLTAAVFSLNITGAKMPTIGLLVALLRVNTFVFTLSLMSSRTVIIIT